MTFAEKVWFNAKLASKIFGVFYFVLHIIA